MSSTDIIQPESSAGEEGRNTAQNVAPSGGGGAMDIQGTGKDLKGNEGESSMVEKGVPVVEGKGPQQPVGDIVTNLVLENTPLTGLKEAQPMKTNHDAPGASGKASSPPPLDSGVIPPSPGRPPVTAVPEGDSSTPLPSVPSIGPLAPTPPPILASLVPGTGGEDLPATSDPTPGNLVQPPSLVDSLAATLPPTSGAPNQSAPHEAAAVDASKPDATVLAKLSVPSTAGPATTPVNVDAAELVAEFGMKWGAVIASTAVNVEEKLPPSVKKKVVDQEPEAGRGKATKDGEEEDGEEDEEEKEKLEERISHHYTKPVKSKAAEKWKRDNMLQAAIDAETVSFSQLVKWKLVFEGYEIDYAWPHRFYAPVDEDIESWVGEYRRQMIDKVMGPDQLAKWEKMENDRLKGLSPSYIQSVIGSRDKRGTATDYDCNKYLLCIALDSLNLDKVETGNFWTRRLKGPSDGTRSEHPALGERFPDLNTQHPFRQLSNDLSKNAFYHQFRMRLKGIKCRLIKANDRLGTGLNITNHVIPPQKKKTGRGTGNHPFDFWVKTDEEAHKLVESRVEEEVAKYVDDNPEVNANYVNQQKLGIRRKIRIEEWKKLPEEKQMAVIAAREEFSSAGNGEENRHMHQSELYAELCHHLQVAAKDGGWHSITFVQQMTETGPAIFVAEHGESPWAMHLCDVPRHKPVFAEFVDALRDLASVKYASGAIQVEPAQVPVIEATGQALVGISDEPHDQDEDARPSARLHPTPKELPPFPYADVRDDSDKSRKALSKWFLGMISALTGAKKQIKSITRAPGNYFVSEDQPTSGGQTIEFASFEHMSPDHFRAWRRHLINAAKGSGKARFRFLARMGEEIELSGRDNEPSAPPQSTELPAPSKSKSNPRSKTKRRGKAAKATSSPFSSPEKFGGRKKKAVSFEEEDEASFTEAKETESKDGSDKSEPPTPIGPPRRSGRKVKPKPKFVPAPSSTSHSSPSGSKKRKVLEVVVESPKKRKKLDTIVEEPEPSVQSPVRSKEASAVETTEEPDLNVPNPNYFVTHESTDDGEEELWMSFNFDAQKFGNDIEVIRTALYCSQAGNHDMHPHFLPSLCPIRQSSFGPGLPHIAEIAISLAHLSHMLPDLQTPSEARSFHFAIPGIPDEAAEATCLREMLLDLTAPLIVPPTSTKAVYDFEMALIAVLEEVSEHLAITGTFLHAHFPLPTIALLARAICYIAICSDERKLVVRLSSGLMRHCMYRYSGNVMHRVWDKLSERTFRSETTQRVVSTVRSLTAFYASSLTIPHGEEDFLCTDDLFSLLPNEDRHWFGIYFGRLLVEMPWFRVGQVGRPGVLCTAVHNSFYLDPDRIQTALTVGPDSRTGMVEFVRLTFIWALGWKLTQYEEQKDLLKVFEWLVSDFSQGTDAMSFSYEHPSCRGLDAPPTLPPVHTHQSMDVDPTLVPTPLKDAPPPCEQHPETPPPSLLPPAASPPASTDTGVTVPDSPSKEGPPSDTSHPAASTLPPTAPAALPTEAEEAQSSGARSPSSKESTPPIEEVPTASGTAVEKQDEDLSPTKRLKKADESDGEEPPALDDNDVDMENAPKADDGSEEPPVLDDKDVDMENAPMADERTFSKLIQDVSPLTSPQRESLPSAPPKKTSGKGKNRAQSATPNPVRSSGRLAGQPGPQMAGRATRSTSVSAAAKPLKGRK